MVMASHVGIDMFRADNRCDNCIGNVGLRFRIIMTKDEVLKYLRERYTYDAETGTIRHKGRDRAVKGSNNRSGYLLIRIGPNKDKTWVLLHRAAWALYYGRWPKEIDHLNGNKTDNRIENLREVSRGENDQNRVWTWKPNVRTGLPGVCYKEKTKRYEVKMFGSVFFRDKYEAFITTILLGRMYE